ncbi:MAG: TlyA family RNA methyltransferase [Deltaproteobacteria bacterium]|nr:TlyA family RNA methyltransferase [Deltaproteobacteria bacterium]
MTSHQPKKKRIDLLLVEKKLAPSRERAQSLIMAGKVVADDHLVLKSSEKFNSNATLRLKGVDHPYVSRGGLKLKAALDHFKICVKDFVCVDMGASTGGFTDCLLQAGASKVYAIDVGTNQLAYTLRQDPRVISFEKLHVKDLRPEIFAEPINLVVVDVAFISLTQVIPHLVRAIPGQWNLVALIKPQFEVGKGEVEKGGVIHSSEKQQAVIKKILEFLKGCDFQVQGVLASPILGDKGNQEYLVYATR